MATQNEGEKPNEYVEIYNKLGGYYGESEAIRGDTRGYLYSKASGLANDSYSSMKESSKYPLEKLNPRKVVFQQLSYHVHEQ